MASLPKSILYSVKSRFSLDEREARDYGSLLRVAFGREVRPRL